MARARNIKPGFYKNEDLAECSVWARFIFPGLWMLADREGRLEDRPKRIKGELLPFDTQDSESLLNELETRGFILRYKENGIAYIQIIAFSKHQNPHHKEPKSVIPPPKSLGFYPHATNTKPEALHPCDDNETSDKPEIKHSTSEIPSGVNRADSGFRIPDSLNLNPDSKPPSLRDVPPGDAKKKKSNAVPLSQWLHEVKAKGEKAVSDYTPLWEHCTKVGIPTEWIEIAWLKFRERYTTDEKAARKRYANWRLVFLRAVSENWLNLWYWSDKDQTFHLTTVGVTADMATREAA